MDRSEQPAKQRFGAADAQFVRRLLISIVILATVAALWALRDLWPLVFAAVLVAVVLRAIADPIAARTGMSQTWSLLFAVLLIGALFAATGFLFGYQIAGQFQGLFERLPRSMEMLRNMLQLGAWDDLLKGSASASAIGHLVASAATWGSTVVGVFASLAVVVFGGIYFAVDPRQYRDGLLMLVPPAYQTNASATLDDCGMVLKRWVLAQLLAMLAVGVLVATGLTLVGTPSALALGLIAGLAEFIPYVGPLTAVVPALVVAGAQDSTLLLYTLGVYVVVQQIENNLLMPLIASRAIAVPPGLAIFMIVAMGILFGPLGLLLGFPLALMVNVIVKRLYVLDTLGEPVEIAGEPAVASDVAASK